MMRAFVMKLPAFSGWGGCKVDWFYNDKFIWEGGKNLIKVVLSRTKAGIKSNMHQQKKHLLRTDRKHVRTQGIRSDRPVRPVRPVRAPVQPVHPSPLGATQPTSCPPGVPGWSISHNHLLKHQEE